MFTIRLHQLIIWTRPLFTFYNTKTYIIRIKRWYDNHISNFNIICKSYDLRCNKRNIPFI